MRRNYAFYAILEPSSDGGFGVYFPDLPGATSGGDSKEAAAINAREGLALHLRGTLEDGDPIPKPTAPEKLDVPEGCEAAKISVDLADFFPELFADRRGGPRTGAGRPKKEPGERTGRQAARTLIVRLTDDEFEDLARAALKRGKTKSEYVRELIAGGK